MTTKQRLILIMLAVLVAISCCCASIVWVGGFAPARTATSTPTWTVMPMVAPTATSVPEGPPPEVVSYVLKMTSKIQVLGDCLFDLGRLLSAPKFGDEDWTISVAANIVAIQEIHRGLTEMRAPPEMAEIHAAVLDATGDFSAAMDYVVTGIDNMSVEDIHIASGLMDSGGEKLQRAFKMLEEYSLQFADSVLY